MKTPRNISSTIMAGANLWGSMGRAAVAIVQPIKAEFYHVQKN